MPFWEDVTVRRQPHLRPDLQPARQSGHHATTAAASSTPPATRWTRSASWAASRASCSAATLALQHQLPDGAEQRGRHHLRQRLLDARTCARALPAIGGSGMPDAVERSAASGTVAPGQRHLPFFNIFGSSVTTTPGSLLANTTDMVALHHRAGLAALRDQGAACSTSCSPASCSSLPAGRVGVAIGAPAPPGRLVGRLHRRCRTRARATCRPRSSTRRWARSPTPIFAEVSVPLMKSAAVRRARLHRRRALREHRRSRPVDHGSEAGPAVFLARRHGKLRGTWSTSFLAPSLYQRFRQNVRVHECGERRAHAANDNLSRVPTTVRGNPQLRAADLGELQPGLHA